MAQIPAILLVERVGLRKLLTVVFAVASRLSLVAADFTPSLPNSFLSASGLNMGMRRMTAFPYEMLRKTTRSTTSTISRVTRRKPQE